MQKTEFIDAFEKSAQVSRIRDSIEPAALLTAVICALMDGADRIEQIPCFLEKNRKFTKSLGLPRIPHPTTIYKLLKRINKDGVFAQRMKNSMQEIISKWYL
ncbi:MAG: transposase family protein [Exilispira sp.]|nr:transposase family protein [Exilispira sp.]